MRTIQDERSRIERLCRSLHDAADALYTTVYQDRNNAMMLTEFCDYTIRTSWDWSETRHLSDSALMGLICERKVKSLKAARVMLQKEIEMLETCHG